MERTDSPLNADCTLPEREFNVIVVGAGPAGLTCAMWMAKQNISTLLIDAKADRVASGHADGLEPRSWEILDSFGLAMPLWEIANKTNELSVWASSSDGNLSRKFRRSNAAVGVSRFREATLSQGYVEEAFLHSLEAYSCVKILRNTRPTHLSVEPASGKTEYRVKVTAETVDPSNKDFHTELFHARYMIGCDGAHSWTRKALGIPFNGDSSGSLWGVMDVVPVTDFPDIRNRCIIKSERADASLMTIPRERGLVRFYTQLNDGEWQDSAEDKSSRILREANKIMSPYTVDFSTCEWSTYYEVAQRLATQLSAHDCVFLCGDAIHNISPKAGMGMNASIQDAYNLGWKIGNVLRQDARAKLLDSYAAERGQVAKALVAFDRGFSKHFTESRQSADDDLQGGIDDEHTVISGIFTNYRKLSPDQWAGQRGSSLMDNDNHGFLSLGGRIPDVQIVNQSDGCAISLHKILPATGKWRLLVLPGGIARAKGAMAELQNLCRTINSSNWGYRSCMEILTIHSSPRTSMNYIELPRELVPFDEKNGYACNVVFADDDSYHDGHGKAYSKLFGDELWKGIVLVRPDMHVGFVGTLEQFEETRKVIEASQ